jgi:hypothetical protein
MQLSGVHFLYLREMVVVGASLYQKVENYIATRIFNLECYRTGNVFSRYLKSVTTYIGNSVELCKYLQITV